MLPAPRLLMSPRRSRLPFLLISMLLGAATIWRVGSASACSDYASQFRIALRNTQVGQVTDLIVDGPYIYASSPGAFRVLAGQGTSRLNQLASVATHSSGPMVQRGSLVYVARTTGLSVISVEDPRHPRELYYGGEHDYEKFAVHGDYLYAAARSEGLIVLDLSNPVHPSVVQILATPGSATDLAVCDSTLYLVAQSFGIRVYSLQNAANPVYLRTAAGSAGSLALEVVGNRLLSATSLLQVWDISDAEMPTLLSTTSAAAGSVYRTKASWPYVFAQSNGGSIIAMSFISDDSLVVTGATCPIGGAAGLCVIPDGLLAYSDTGVTLLDTTNLCSPYHRTLCDVGGRVYDVEAVGNVLVVAASSWGVCTVSLAEGSRGAVISRSTMIYGNRLVVEGSYAYVSHPGFGLAVFRLEVDGRLTPLSVYQVSDVYASCDIAVHYPYVYLAKGQGGLDIVDVSDPEHLVLASHQAQYCTAVACEGEVLFWSGQLGIYVSSLVDPLAPELMAWVSGYDAERLFVQEGRLYGSYGWEGGGHVCVVDVSNPRDPKAIGMINEGWPTDDVVLAEGLLYCASEGGKVVAYDASGLGVPVCIGTLGFLPPHGDYVRAVEVVGDSVIFGAGSKLMSVGVFCKETTAVEGGIEPQGEAALRSCAWPNPSVHETSVRFFLGQSSSTRIDVFDMAGRRVARLADENVLERGWHDVLWKGEGMNGEAMPAGVYFYRIEAEGQVQKGRLVLLR